MKTIIYDVYTHNSDCCGYEWRRASNLLEPRRCPHCRQEGDFRIIRTEKVTQILKQGKLKKYWTEISCEVLDNNSEKER